MQKHMLSSSLLWQAYVLVALIIIVLNVTELLGVFVLIFESAFGLREVAGGALGAAMLQGIKRGYF
ncbi:alanine:cation symporter family protein [Peribacillus frigoritolerans]|uniref:alanine:cation symporter family protein n=1 Tax=Peribacillus frigoritolerans TaxID=450367 RepID=UPI003F536DB3